jgi:RimJ/RimL family protein N-acetyltransferase
MKYFRKISGSRCYLSPINPDDYEKYTEWLNDPEVAVHLHLFPDIITLSGEREFLDRLSREGHTFAIVDLETNELIGNCGFPTVDFVNRCSDFGIFIGNKRYWNRGYGEEAVTLALDYGFNILNLTNIMLTVFSFNRRAIACYRKCGFREIGRRRKAKLLGGREYDILFMDILAEELRNPVLGILPEPTETFERSLQNKTNPLISFDEE